MDIGVKGVQLVPYKLPHFIRNQVIYVCEGEADAEALWKWGLPATTNVAGVGKWRSEYNRYFEGKQVVLLPDHDAVGEAHMQDIANNLFPVARALKIVHLPDLSTKGDFTDWKEGGGTPEQFREIVKSTHLLTREGIESWKKQTPSHGFKLTPFLEFLNEQDEEIDWLVEQHLPIGGLSLLGGKPKAGKSTLARCLALSVARGKSWLGLPTTQGSVFHLGLEEKRSEVRKHFKAMGAAPEDAVSVFISPSPENGVVKLYEAAEREHPALIIVDPILKMVRVKDANDYATMSNAFEPLMTLPRQTGAHVLGVHHMNKMGSGGDAILGSTAIFAAVDTALILKRAERYRTLFSIQRYGQDLEETVLVMDPDTLVISAGGTRKENDEGNAAEMILEYLRTQSEPVEGKDIHESVEARKAVTLKALRSLFEQSKVVREGQGKRGNPYRYSVSSSLVPTIYREPLLSR